MSRIVVVSHHPVVPQTEKVAIMLLTQIVVNTAKLKHSLLQQVVEELQLTGLIPVLWLEQVMVEQVEAEVQVGVQDEMLVVVVLAVGLVVRQIAEVQQAVVAAVAAPKAAVVVTELLL